MKQLSQIISIGIACFFLSGCGTFTSARQLNKVTEGMSKSQVLSILGQPSERQLKNGLETWEYSKLSISDLLPKRVVVEFSNNKVSGFHAVDDNVSSQEEKPVPPQKHSDLRPVSPPPYHFERRGYMSDSEFQFLYDKVKNKPFKDERMELLQVGCLDSRFSCAQCVRIMSIFTWDDDKLAVLRTMAKHIVDPENSISLLKVFSFDSSKRQVEGIMRNARKP